MGLKWTVAGKWSKIVWSFESEWIVGPWPLGTLMDRYLTEYRLSLAKGHTFADRPVWVFWSVQFKLSVPSTLDFIQIVYDLEKLFW